MLKYTIKKNFNYIYIYNIYYYFFKKMDIYENNQSNDEDINNSVEIVAMEHYIKPPLNEIVNNNSSDLDKTNIEEIQTDNLNNFPLINQERIKVLEALLTRYNKIIYQYDQGIRLKDIICKNKEEYELLKSFRLSNSLSREVIQKRINDEFISINNKQFEIRNIDKKNINEIKKPVPSTQVVEEIQQIHYTEDDQNNIQEQHKNKHSHKHKHKKHRFLTIRRKKEYNIK